MEITSETITTTLYRFALSDSEIAAILVDPTDFQRELRHIRATQNNGKHGAKDPAHLFKKAREKKSPKDVGKNVASATGYKPLEPCPECGKLVKASGLKLHRRKKHGVTDFA